MITLKLPRISMNMVEATIAKWHVAPGQQFQKGAVLCDIETEKVTTEITAEGDGEVVEIIAPEGSDIQVGAPLCKLRPI